MTRRRYCVSSIEISEDAQGMRVYRVRLRPDGRSAPHYVHHVMQPAERAAPYAVGALVDLDPRLLDPDGE